MARIVGTPNDDRLFGTDEDDRILGGRGDDRLFGGLGDDVLAGGRDNDLLAGGRGDDRTFGGPGNDRIFGGPGNDDLRGGLGNDDLRGALGNDRIFGNAGDDRLFGNAGNDVLAGGLGNDLIAGGLGNDRIFGHLGNDALLGRGGDDVIFGGPGADRIFGGNGDDRLVGQAGADTLTGGAGADEFVYGALAHGVDRITDFNPGEGDELALVGALEGAEEVRVQDGDDTVVSVRTNGTVTELVRLENFVDGQPGDGRIEVWYGDTQTFGDPGVPQQWVNILGKVDTDGLNPNGLSYSLNGGPAQNLTFASDSGNFNRLANQGDFNIELDYGELDPSPNDDLVTIRATYGNGDVFTQNVLIDFEGGNTWPRDFSIDWGQENDIQDAVQVVDGLWSFDDNGVRPVEMGFDRILALGDETWDHSYEVRVSVTMHDIINPDVGGEGVLFGMQWGGHTDPEFGGLHTNFIPLAHFRVASDVIQLRPSEFFPDANPDNPSPVGRGFQFQEGETYEFLIQNERIAGSDDRAYGIKTWAEGAQEPDDFWIRHTMTDQEPDGSFLMIAHFVDVTFGDVTVRELPPLQSAPPNEPQALQVADVVDDGNSLEPMLAGGSESSGSASTQSAGGGGGTSGSSVAMADLLASGDETALAA